MKQAALALHALAPADREWMLARLPSAHREELEALLGELNTLGIPQDRTLVSTVLEKRAARAPDGVVFGSLLQGEPQTLIALARDPSPSAPPALREAVRQELATRLEAAGHASPAARPRRDWRRWFGARA